MKFKINWFNFWFWYGIPTMLLILSFILSIYDAKNFFSVFLVTIIVISFSIIGSAYYKPNILENKDEI